MPISWTKEWDATDDGSLVTGAQIGTMQADIDAGTTGTLPTPGVSDALKVPRVNSAHSAYELVAQVAMAAGGTGSDLSAGTAGYAVVSQGTAGNMTLAPLYTSVSVTFGTTSAAQVQYCIAPVTGNVSGVFACNYTSARSADVTVKIGSAGTTVASGTAASGVEGVTSTITLGTVAVSAGGSLSVARGVQGSDGVSQVTIIMYKTP